jgi:hypothetical protein
MPDPCTVLDWCEAHPEFGLQYARDRTTGYKLLADEIVDIADDQSRDTVVLRDEAGKVIDEVQNTEWINRSRLRVDTRKWLLSKVLPKVYGDRLELAGQVDIGLSARIVAARLRATQTADDSDASDLV